MIIKSIRFATGFEAAAALAVFLNVLPYLWSHVSLTKDAYITCGFPFVFQLEGGLDWRYEFSCRALLADIGLALAAAFAVGYACARVRSRD